mmetsp:Transcript_24976/g.42797  ORF Transcript_24976/g.42797 Transcript_24976/m.42797 type:complete len:142 (-) Transcript_24976:168-593(-)
MPLYDGARREMSFMSLRRGAFPYRRRVKRWLHSAFTISLVKGHCSLWKRVPLPASWQVLLSHVTTLFSCSEIGRILSHPFIVKLYQALQDAKYMYSLMDLLPGGELMDLLQRKGKFSESWTQFYGGTVLSALQAIHAKQIA